ncbi:hypothetical protein HPB50_000897 [Hyalomma asiaticum]|uniref:Uncharacterized protein n=1 Tax=Hyalomma asiaticum TaxID=266040 RepID=A0ACB7S9J1_HYAAI|nr:hypothetical protein HPB50_000897 [Hyalomma asiaticum]
MEVAYISSFVRTAPVIFEPCGPRHVRPETSSDCGGHTSSPKTDRDTQEPTTNDDTGSQRGFERRPRLQSSHGSEEVDG